MGKKVMASVRLKIEIVYYLDDRWGTEATISQIHTTAKREAAAKIRSLLGNKGSIQGEPEAIVTLTESTGD